MADPVLTSALHLARPEAATWLIVCFSFSDNHLLVSKNSLILGIHNELTGPLKIMKLIS